MEDHLTPAPSPVGPAVRPPVPGEGGGPMRKIVLASLVLRRARLLAFVGLTLVAVGAVSVNTTLPASALTKVRSPLPLATEPFVIEGLCPFAITYQDIRGSGMQTLVFDAAGNLVRIDIHPHGVISQVTANGKTLTFNNSGPVSVFP